MLAREEVLLVVNPRAGGGWAKRIDWQRVCASFDAPCRVVWSQSAQDALLHASQFCLSGGRVLVVAGGDGSVHAVLPALMHTSTALALLPLGTSNVLARELGYPLGRMALRGCLQALQAGAVRQMDVGVVNGRPFALMASTGFDAHVLPRVPEGLKKRWGVFAFIWTGLRELRRYQPTRYLLTIDGGVQETEAVLLVASNTSRYGWFTVIAPSARIDDGLLDLVWFPAGAHWRRKIWWVLRDVLRGRAGQCAYLRFARAQSLLVEASSVQPVQCDGELVGETPMAVHIVPSALRVIAASPPALSRNAV
ncbi:MAG: diacylglycerol kinase family lipid kinase [Armatimonadota bacterium]|nr:diacylglycerol kinase family lipid kinase [Armatimonadota bacterium]